MYQEEAINALESETRSLHVSHQMENKVLT
jgi:hypothetical protein